MLLKWNYFWENLYFSICLFACTIFMTVCMLRDFHFSCSKKVFKTIRFFKLCFAHSSAIKITYTCITGIKNVNGYNKSNRQHSLRNSIGVIRWWGSPTTSWIRQHLAWLHAQLVNMSKWFVAVWENRNWNTI